MKTGEAYWDSRQKRSFDMAVVSTMAPLLAAATQLLLRDTRQSPDDVILYQARIGGNNGIPFNVEKLRTLNPDGLVRSPLAARYRKLGIDELAQARNIRRRQMSVCGFRPLVAESTVTAMGRDMVLDLANKKDGQAWDRMTKVRRPGIVSSYALFEHTAPEDLTAQDMVNQRVEMDLRDAKEDSLANNMDLLRQFASIAINRRLR